jgi:RimJ/RimL family protein N-acetyltransferase
VNLAVAPLTDREAVDRILKSAPIGPKLRHDEREPGFIDHPLVTHWGAWLDGELVGVFLAVRFSRWEVEAHVGILPCALHASRELARLFLARIFEHPEIERVTAYVLGTLPSAGNFCGRLGFEYEGKRRGACRVGGTLCDVLIYGMTRQDWVLQQTPA